MSDPAAITKLAVLAEQLDTNEQRLWTLLVAGQVEGAVYFPDRHGWYLPGAAVEQLRRLL